jgi:1-acyl-sn-glycerol-3-phosphate acyltransferase
MRGSVLLFCVAGCLCEYGIRVAGRKLTPVCRAAILQKWSARLLSAIRISITVHGQVPDQGLIVSNHLSYLDILVFSAACGCVFVSKREVKSWPGVGWAASLSGSIYIDRSLRSDTHAIQPQIQAALANGLRLVVFPEGTSTDGSQVLRFHSSLFQSAVDLGAPITAACLAYAIADGDAATEACYWGDMVLFTHLLNLLKRDSVQATLKFSSKHFRFRDRKEAARTMQQQVELLRWIPVEVQA